jgi:hypothetical protein
MPAASSPRPPAPTPIPTPTHEHTPHRLHCCSLLPAVWVGCCQHLKLPQAASSNNQLHDTRRQLLLRRSTQVACKEIHQQLNLHSARGGGRGMGWDKMTFALTCVWMRRRGGYTRHQVAFDDAPKLPVRKSAISSICSNKRCNRGPREICRHWPCADVCMIDKGAECCHRALRKLTLSCSQVTSRTAQQATTIESHPHIMSAFVLPAAAH